jgi:hypothetical protein
MRASIMVLFSLAGITSTHAGELDLNRLFRSPLPTIEVAAACILVREYMSGANKFCVYDCQGSKTTTTISKTELCPINIDR